MKLKRIQRKRTKGWKMPANTVYVGRPTKWGNPYIVIDYPEEAIQLYKEMIELDNNLEAELEELKGGGFYIVDDKLNFEHVKLKLKEVASIQLDLSDLTPEQAKEKIKFILNQDLKDKIVTLRLYGKLSSGSASDLKLKELLETINCFSLLKNTSKLSSKDFEEVEISENPLNLESDLIEIHTGQLTTFTKEVEIELTKTLITSLDTEKKEGEKNIDFENRIIKDALVNLKK